jgi:hypothetical protein
MEESSKSPQRRFPPPWTAERPSADTYAIKDANGVTVALVPCRDDLNGVPFYHSYLTPDEARRIAKAITRIPEFLQQRHGFHVRGASPHRWSRLRPYHVALQDDYIRGRWDWINEVCKMNRIPFDGTGERIQRGGCWCVYEFAVQLEAIQFWAEFEGRWLVGEEFIHPDRPENLPPLMKPDWKPSKPGRG